MIPDFKTFIKESIWSDIQDRSSGETDRKEDDIDLLDINEFCEYLKTIYKTDSDNDIKVLEIEDNHKIEKYLVICLYQDESGYYRYIYYNGTQIDTQLDVIENLNCRSEFERKFSTIHSTNDFDVVCIDIYPKDKTRVPVTNKFFIEVLDFILDRIDAPLEQQIEKISNIKESIWSDIQDRSSGETIRKEDDINRMNCDELYDFIYELYEPINPFPVPFKSGEGTSDKNIQYFSIPIFKVNYKVYKLDTIFKNDKISALVLMATDVVIKDFKQALIDNFDVTIRSDQALKIEEKDGTLTNQTCMKLISVIVENAPEPYLKKREN